MNPRPLRAYAPHRFRWGVWAAMLALVGACALLPSLAGEGPTAAEAPGGWVLVVLSAVGLATALATWVVRLSLLERPVRRGVFDPRTRPGSRRADAASLAVWALCLCVAAYGLLHYALGGGARELYAFLSSSALLLWIHAPRRAALRRAARQLDAHPPAADTSGRRRRGRGTREIG